MYVVVEIGIDVNTSSIPFDTTSFFVQNLFGRNHSISHRLQEVAQGPERRLQRPHSSSGKTVKRRSTGMHLHPNLRLRCSNICRGRSTPRVDDDSKPKCSCFRYNPLRTKNHQNRMIIRKWRQLKGRSRACSRCENWELSHSTLGGKEVRYLSAKDFFAPKNKELTSFCSEISLKSYQSASLILMFVQIGCPRLSIDWGVGFSTPSSIPTNVCVYEWCGVEEEGIPWIFTQKMEKNGRITTKLKRKKNEIAGYTEENR